MLPITTGDMGWFDHDAEPSMAEARSMFQIAGYLILFPGICLSLTVLAVNLLGDGMRDALDPRLARRM